MRKNEEGKLVFENNEYVFKNELFNQLTSREHLYQISPNALYLDTQYNQVFASNPEDTHNYIVYHCNRLIDDNASLASSEDVQKQYINDVVCFGALVKKIYNNADENYKNQVLGGLFATKNDESADSKVPLYLCGEMIQAKCLKYKDMPLEKLDVFDVSPNAEVTKDSTLWQQLDSVVADLKTVEFENKNYFGDMSQDSMNYLSACQIDPNGSVDIFVKCEEDKSLLFVTQGENVQQIEMFKVNKELQNENSEVQAPVAEAPVEVPTAEAPVEVPTAEAPVQAPVAEVPVEAPVAETPSVEAPVQTPAVEANVETNDVISGDSIPSINDSNVNVNFANNDLLNKMGPRFTVTIQEYKTQTEDVKNKYNNLIALKAQLKEAEDAYTVAVEDLNSKGAEFASMFEEFMGQNNIEAPAQEENTMSKAA